MELLQLMSGLPVPAPVSGAIEPAAQGIGAVTPSEHAWPAGQMWQPACEVRPVALPKDPAAHGLTSDAPGGQYPLRLHSLHPVEPVSSWYVLASQASQVAASDELVKRPGGQGCGDVAPVPQNEPTVHERQSDWLALPSAA